MKYKLTWGEFELDAERKYIVGVKYLSQLSEDIEKLIEFGYTFFTIEILKDDKNEVRLK